MIHELLKAGAKIAEKTTLKFEKLNRLLGSDF